MARRLTLDQDDVGSSPTSPAMLKSKHKFTTED